MNFHAEYERRCANKQSDIHAHLPTLYHFASAGNCSVIELGVRGGDSTAAFLAALQDHGGYLWSCDIDPPKMLSRWQPEAPFWTFVQGDDLWAASSAPTNVDVLFIDTSHTYSQTVAELEMYADKVRPGGVILLHDTELKAPAASPASDPPFPVRVAVEEFAAERGWDLRFLNGCYGLGVLMVPEVDDD